MSDFQFNLYPTDYDPTNALWLGRAAKLAYEDAATMASTSKTWGFDKCQFFNEPKKDTQAFMIANDEMIIIAFRGTQPDNLKDWMTDLDIERKPGPDGKVHAGFLEAFRLAWPAMETTLKQFRDNAQSLWVTGHSLGAALATLAVASLLERGRPVNWLYTYGQPRTGSWTFARNFNRVSRDRTFRVVNNNDIVARIPFWFRFRHVGRLIYFDDKGTVHKDAHWWNLPWSRLRGRIEDLGQLGTDGIKDHAIARYVELLEEQVRQASDQ